MELARPARDEDHPACLRLLDELLSGARDMRGGPALAGDSTAESLLARWTGPNARLLVGEFEGVVVGLLGATVQSPREGGRGLIEACYVEGEGRGVGVGTALMDAALAWCKEQRCNVVDAVALPGDRATKQRLEAKGFTTRLLTLSRRLD
jgi:GNAT superfamily N-acetyltransferase